MSLATAQQPERRATPITVRDGAGAVVAGAAVRCWAGDDLQEATTDDKGRAVVRLLAWRRYACVAAREVNGDIAASEVTAVVNGFARELRLGEPRDRERAIVYLLDNWDFVVPGPLTVQVSPEATGERFFAADADGWAPAMPPIRRVRVIDGNSGTLWVDGYWGQPQDMPAPLLMPLRCRDADGAPVAGAEVWQRFPGAATHGAAMQPRAATIWRRVGVSDARGELQATVTALASHTRRTALFFEARKPGYANATAGVQADGTLLQERVGLPVPADHVLPFVMTPDQQLRLTPPIAAEVTVLGTAAPGLLDPDEGTQRVTVGKDGVGRLPLPRHAFANRCASFRLADGALMLARLNPTGLGSEVATTGRRVRITVRDALGLPGGDAELIAVASNGTTTSPAIAVPLDATGATDVQLDDCDWFLFVRRDDRVAWTYFAPDRGDEQVELLLQVPPMMTIRFVGKDGEPWPQAAISAGSRRGVRLGSSALRSFLLRLQQELRRDSTPVLQGNLGNPLRIPTLAIPGQREHYKYRVNGRVFEVEIVSGGEATVVVDD